MPPSSTHRQFDVIVLAHDLPEYGLCAGDLGTVVEVYTASEFEVEFVTGAGQTVALVTLGVDDVRPIGTDEIMAVRRHRRSA